MPVPVPVLPVFGVKVPGDVDDPGVFVDGVLLVPAALHCNKTQDVHTHRIVVKFFTARTECSYSIMINELGIRFHMNYIDTRDLKAN